MVELMLGGVLQACYFGMCQSIFKEVEDTVKGTPMYICLPLICVGNQ